MSTQPTGVQFDARLSFFFFLTAIFPLTIEIDGVETKGKWGVQFLNLAPGTHRITASWKMYWLLPVNKATLDVTVAPSQVAPVRYKVRYFFFLPGKMYIDPTPAPAPAAAPTAAA
jgi:hypothetical protein